MEYQYWVGGSSSLDCSAFRKETFLSRLRPCRDGTRADEPGRVAGAPTGGENFGIRLAHTRQNLQEIGCFWISKQTANPHGCSLDPPSCHAGGRGFEPRPLHPKKVMKTATYEWLFSFLFQTLEHVKSGRYSTQYYINDWRVSTP
jgi:hypothetical protein